MLWMEYGYDIINEQYPTPNCEGKIYPFKYATELLKNYNINTAVDVVIISKIATARQCRVVIIIILLSYSQTC